MINKATIITILSSTLILFAGCSGMSKKDCNATNWEAEGRQDGLKGYSENRILETSKTCKEMGVDISTKEYKTGWLQGIEEYCSPKNAFKLGVEKKEAKIDNCPVELRSKFKTNYNRAEKYEKIRKDIDETKQEIEELRVEIDELENKREELLTKKKTIEEKAKMLSSQAVKYEIY